MLGHENNDLFREGPSKKAFSILESNFEDLFEYGQSHERRHGHKPTLLNATSKNPNGMLFYLILWHLC